MSFKLEVNKGDLARITQRLTKIVTELQNPSGPVLRYKVYLLNEYKRVIAEAMGSVDASGGSVRLEFDMGSTSTWWAGLSPFTKAIKAYRKGTTTANLVIWEDTGDTKNAVQVWGDFAGIDGSKTPEAYKRAMNTEYGGTLGDLGGFGGEWPKRALFTIANDLFNRNRTEIVYQVRKRIAHTIQQSGWGR